MTVLLLSSDQADLVEAVAQRVVQLLEERERAQQPAAMVDATTLALLLGVDRSFVYRHADELGAVKLGTGRQPRLRFDLEAARAAMDRSESGRSEDDTSRSEPRDGGGSNERPRAIRGRSQRRMPSRLPPAGSVLPIRGKS